MAGFYGRRRRTFRRRGRRSGRGRSSMWNIAKKAAGKIVKYYLNPEYKFLDVTNTSVTPPTTGIVMPDISTIAQGDSATDRDGNSIKITSQMFRATVTKNAAATSTKCRVVIFTDVSSNGTAPSGSDVLQDPGGLSGLINAPVNRVNGSRFHIWFDHTYVLDSDNPKRHIQFFKKMQHHIHYLTSAGTSAALGQGAFYLLAISDEATNTPTLSFTNRFRFLDN